MKMLKEFKLPEYKKERGMDIEHVRHLLNKWGNEAIELAQKLRDSGDPLSDKEKNLLKMAKFAYLEEALREADRELKRATMRRFKEK